jgi:hypothetical protein
MMKKKMPTDYTDYTDFFRVFRRSFSCHLIMMPRPHPETKENQHQRFAQHIGPPCHGVAQHIGSYYPRRGVK